MQRLVAALINEDEPILLVWHSLERMVQLDIVGLDARPVAETQLPGDRWHRTDTFSAHIFPFRTEMKPVRL